jgi:hypothetical protein
LRDLSNFYTKAKATIEKLKFILAEKIKDPIKQGIKVCDQEAEIKKGDVAYLLLDKALPPNEGIPFYDLFQIQLDFYECKYPFGLFDYIDENRNMVSQKVMAYLRSK